MFAKLKRILLTTIFIVLSMTTLSKLLAQDEPFPTVISNSDWTPIEQQFDDVTMVLVPPGCFMMGSETNDDEMPVHEQCFEEAFWIDKYEVTRSQFSQFGGEKALDNGLIDSDHPVAFINWFEARDFCTLRSSRLPSEAEWEYAARGPESLTYPWGNSWDSNNAVWDNGMTEEISMVGSITQGISWVGALDLSGNVSEWVNSQYQDYPFIPNDGSEEDDTDIMRVTRGGSYINGDESFLRAADRYGVYPTSALNTIGFRCTRSLEVNTGSNENSVNDEGGSSSASCLAGSYEVAYLSNRILVLSTRDGSNIETILPDPRFRIDAQWSPDGTKIAYAQANGSEYDIFIYDLTDGLTYNYTNSRDIGESNPRWSPDSTKLAFLGNDDIYVIDADGNNIQNLTETPTVAENIPTWSPNGTQLIYSAAVMGASILTNGLQLENDLFILDLSSQTVMNLTETTDLSEVQPNWSSDGNLVVFTLIEPLREGVRNLGNNIDLATLDIETREIVMLTETQDIDEQDPKWSPDGSHIAFHTVTELHIMDRDGGNMQSIYDASPIIAINGWSPNGTHIAVESNRPVQVSLIDVDDQTVVTLDMPNAMSSDLSWYNCPD